jgi:hypothetical protein
MTLSLMILPASSNNFSTLYNDKGSGADGDVQFWRPAGQTVSAGTFLPVGDVCEASPSGWIYDSNPPLGQVILVGGVLGTDVANPKDFVQIWKDDGSGAALNGAIWEMVVPPGFVALGHCCSFAPSGEPPPKPNVSNYFCVAQSQVTTGTAGPQIWNTLGSNVDRPVSTYGSSASAPFVDLHTFWATPDSDGPPSITTLVLIPGPAFVKAPAVKSADRAAG